MKWMRSEHFAEIEMLFREHAPRVYRLAYGYFGTAQEAEDATQETFLRAIQKYGQFRREAEASTWLYRVAVNVCIDGLRRERRRRCEPLDAAMTFSSFERPSEELEKKDLSASVRRVIDQLRPQQRLLIVLRELEELSYEEIRRITGLSIGTISSRLNRARREIFTRLRAQHGVVSG